MQLSPYRLSGIGYRLLFGPVSRWHIWDRLGCEWPRPSVMAANHISHFDPLILTSVLRPKIDWMTDAEFFRHPLGRLYFRGCDCFPVDRSRSDMGAVREALGRLRAGRVVGIFPDGGIRDGGRSFLEGAPLQPGATALAAMAGVPIVPVVILGTDRLYRLANWVPLRRVPVWIGIGSPVWPPGDGGDRRGARARFGEDLCRAFAGLYAGMRERFGLGQEDLPKSPQRRMAAW